MNDRIKELARHAGFELNPAHFDHEKFAELIVAECIRQVDLDNGHGNNEWDRALTFVSKHLKEHFGVE